MANPPRRAHERFPCDIPVAIYSPVTESKITEARFLDLSRGGASVYVETLLQKGVPYQFRFVWENHRLRVTGRVAWEAKRDPQKPAWHRYGINLTLSTRQEEFFKRLIDRLRVDNQEDRRDFMRDYWRR